MPSHDLRWPNLPPREMTQDQRDTVVHELTLAAFAATDRAETLLATGQRSVELAVVELRELSAQLHRRLHLVRTPS